MIPKTVDVGCYTYQVEITDKPLILDGNECSATIDYRNQKIQITNCDVGEQTMEQSFWHEVVHAIVYYFGLDFDKNDEEDIVETLGLGIYTVLKQNGLMPGQDINKILGDETE